MRVFFFCNLGVSTSVAAELWGLVLGLRLAKALEVQSVLAKMDSSVVCNMVLLRQTHCLWLCPLLHEVIRLVTATDWSCRLRHVYRESNPVADALASMGHGSSFRMIVLEAAPANLQQLLGEDMRGVALPRLVL